MAVGCASTHRITPQLAAEGADFAQATPLRVRLSSFRFTPATLRLQAGRPYALTLVNTSSMEHTFAAPEFFATAQVRPDEAARIASGEVQLAQRQSVTLHLIPRAGAYDFACTKFGHATLGMRGKIIVE
jgi:plastocyanin